MRGYVFLNLFNLFCYDELINKLVLLEIFRLGNKRCVRKWVLVLIYFKW